MKPINMKMKPTSLICAAILALPMVAAAENFSYRYADVTHFPKVELDAGGFDDDGDGLQLRGSLPVYQNIFALAEYQQLDLDSGIDVSRFLIGAGGHWALGPKLDLVARGGIAKYDVDFGPFEDDDTGLFAGVRVRTTVAPNVEVEGGLEHMRIDVAGVEDDTYLVGEGRYNFTPQWSAGVIVTLGGDISVIGAHGRFNF